MSTQIQLQADKVWKTVVDPNTLKTYQQALSLTWTILKEAAQLVWLLLCLSVIWVSWLWNGSIWAGKAVRNWLNGLEKMERPTTDRLLSEAGKKLLDVSKTGAAVAVSQARSQLGMPEPPAPEPVVVEPPKPVSVPTPPVAAKVEPPVSTPAPAPVASTPAVETRVATPEAEDA